MTVKQSLTNATTRRPNTNKIKQTKKLLLAALEQSLGVVTTACKIAGFSRGIFYEYYNKDPDFKKAVDSIEDIALDFAESQLHQQIRDGEVASTIFYLKTKGKGRGYIEKTQTEHLGADGRPITNVTNVIVEFTDSVNDDDRRLLLDDGSNPIVDLGEQ